MEVDFENEGGETYICGNPPYLGSKWQSKEQKADLEAIFAHRTKGWKSLDYVSGWFQKAADYSANTRAASAFVSTNSICQGAQVPILWPEVFSTGNEIFFAHTSFNWSNLASNNAGVTVVIVGISNSKKYPKLLFSETQHGESVAKEADNINGYLLSAPDVLIEGCREPRNGLSPIADGSGPLDGGHLLLEKSERDELIAEAPEAKKFIRLFLGSQEIIKGLQRWCIWIEDSSLSEARSIGPLDSRINAVLSFRENAGTRAKTAIGRPHRFAWINQPKKQQIAIPKVFSVRRQYITAEFMDSQTVISNRACIVIDPKLYEFSIISSRLHWVWIATVCVRLRTDLSYSGTIGWNNFPIPKLTEKNREDLTRCAEDILLAREKHFPATIADLYDPENMPEDLRRAHERNDEVLERIYIGRRFRNDTERLEKLFDLYTQMTAASSSDKARKVN